MMGDKTWQFRGTPGPTIWLPSYTSYKKGDKRRLRRETKTCDSLDPKHHHPALKLHKLQEGRQEEIMMGDNNYEFFGTILEPLQ